MAQKKEKRSPKGSRFDCKQKHGHSRAAYFALAPFRIPANKAKRIEKERKRQLECAKERKRTTVVEV